MKQKELELPLFRALEHSIWSRNFELPRFPIRWRAPRGPVVVEIPYDAKKANTEDDAAEGQLAASDPPVQG
jgi:hypothetical protein